MFCCYKNCCMTFDVEMLVINHHGYERWLLVTIRRNEWLRQFFFIRITAVHFHKACQNFVLLYNSLKNVQWYFNLVFQSLSNSNWRIQKWSLDSNLTWRTPTFNGNWGLLAWIKDKSIYRLFYRTFSPIFIKIREVLTWNSYRNSSS